jgi:excisionase family DNA binding protein
MFRPTHNQDRLIHFLADIRSLPSLLEQITFLARLRDPNTGVYHTPAIPERSRAEDVHRTLSLLHEKAFRRWVGLSLEGKKTDLELYLSGFGPSRPNVIRTWLNIESYRMLIPGSSPLSDRRLFWGDLKILLELLAVELRLLSPAGEPAVTDKTLLSVKQVAAMLNMPPRTLRLWAATGGIPAIKAGRQWRFRRHDIQRWLRERST